MCSPNLATCAKLGLASKRVVEAVEVRFSNVNLNNISIGDHLDFLSQIYSHLLNRVISFLPTHVMNTAKETASKASAAGKELEQKLEEKLILLWDELSPWQRDNHYIRSGYRAQSNSYLRSWKSLGYVHNETVNIYSHLLGALLAIVSGIALYLTLGSRYETATREDVLVLSCFFAGAVACLGMSATYHTIQNHSHEVAVWGNKLDYLGIVFLIWGSFIPVLYYAFGDEPELRRTYWTMVSPCIPLM